ncbi:SDR family oxidoreductase [Aquibacillus koreensis]|uniref:SDR family oxidoreductase n=1 Tax=Aquibacillus koreensis TaxID=279446 RepID=A0A9X3WNT3_9BACI|nr:SDR family oxidoreductase [Aquibacillus koreensis]MCT2537233.1 SDR family oxidoreductase [Aquibacillus koreensis]MDC3421581.1 SDR family oxidoreductase [Aquibacillus koreensis]
MDLGLKGKSIIVTAASKGLGKATALEYAREGAHVLIASRDETQLQQTVEEIKQESENPNIQYIVCDVKKPTDIQQMVQAAVDWNGTVDVLINNAGGPPAGTFDQFSDEDWQHAFELNLLSVIRSVREVLPYMKKQGHGHIVTIASSSIKQSLDNLLLSNVFRPGILGLAKSLSQELSQYNIFINTVGPGMIKTDRIIDINKQKAKETGTTLEEMMGQAEQTIPIGRLGEPDEFAKAVVFLGSNANTYITGQALIVDGGLVKAL